MQYNVARTIRQTILFGFGSTRNAFLLKFYPYCKFSSISEHSTGEQVIWSQVQNQVQWIRLNRPAQYNAMNEDSFKGVIEALYSAAENPEVKMTIITGNGKYFSSGNDLNNYSVRLKRFNGDLAKAAEDACNLAEIFVGAFIDFPKPLIGLINGPAYGVMATTLPLYDYIIASDTASFTTPFSLLGQSPEGCSTYTFPRILGPSLTSKMLYFGETLSVQEAQQKGFVSHVVPAAELETHLHKWFYDPTKGLVENCYSHSMGNAKKLIRDEQTKKLLHQVNKEEYKILQSLIASGVVAKAAEKFMNKKKQNQTKK